MISGLSTALLVLVTTACAYLYIQSLNCNSPAAENDMLSSIDISTFPACNTADLQNMLDGKT